jgi:hypothetical protein
MKKLPIILTWIILCILSLSSCGGWRDNIKLSRKSAEFSAAGDSIIITTKGDTWWLSSVSVDTANYYSFLGINVLSSSYTVKQDCFTIEKRDKTTLFIKLLENPLSVNRIVKVWLEAGDYFDSVKITQKAK